MILVIFDMSSSVSTFVFNFKNSLKFYFENLSKLEISYYVISPSDAFDALVQIKSRLNDIKL